MGGVKPAVVKKHKRLLNPTKHDEWGLGKLTEDEADIVLSLRRIKRKLCRARKTQRGRPEGEK